MQTKQTKKQEKVEKGGTDRTEKKIQAFTITKEKFNFNIDEHI